jgi:hypothetical protein
VDAVTDFLDETLALAQETRRQLRAHKALDAVRALHTPSVWTVGLHDGIFERATLCDCCRTLWPCETVRAITEAGA